MPTSMLHLGALLLTWVLQAAWQAGVLALVVLTLTRLLGRRLHPRWRYAFWLIVFARLALPVLAESRFSLFQFVADIGLPQSSLLVDSTARSAQDGTEGSRPWTSSNSVASQYDSTVNSGNTSSVINGSRSVSVKRRARSVIQLAVGAWLAGMVILLSRFATSLVRLGRRQREWDLVTDAEILGLLQACQRELGVSRPLILYASDNLGPATGGVIQAWIVIPRRLLKNLSHDELRLILLHELVHVRRHDVLADQLVTVVTMVHWFHPVGWFCRHVLRNERELVCDATVLAHTRAANPADYGRLILKTIELLHAPFASPAGLVGIFSGKSQSLLQRRIHLIADYRRPAWSYPWFGAIPLLALAVMGLTVPACNVNQAPQQTETVKPDVVNPDVVNPDVVKVVVGNPEAKNAPVTVRYVCQIRAHRRIKVRAIQRGFVDAIPVNEGQQVQRDEVLFRIKPTRSPEGPDAGKPEDQVTEQSLITINAPFDGSIGQLAAQEGSLVLEGDQLTTLTDDSQLWVYFNVPEVHYLKYMADRKRESDNLQIELMLTNGEKFSEAGTIGAIQADFDSPTGTVSFRADFPNPQRRLRHGQTGTILINRVIKNAIVIPQSAAFEVLQKRYVYVVDVDNVAHRREIVIENEFDDRFIVKSGLTTDDRIILQGIRQVRDGEKVTLAVRPRILLADGDALSN